MKVKNPASGYFVVIRQLKSFGYNSLLASMHVLCPFLWTGCYLKLALDIITDVKRWLSYTWELFIFTLIFVKNFNIQSQSTLSRFYAMFLYLITFAWIPYQKTILRNEPAKLAAKEGSFCFSTTNTPTSPEDLIKFARASIWINWSHNYKWNFLLWKNYAQFSEIPKYGRHHSVPIENEYRSILVPLAHWLHSNLPFILFQ